MKSYSNTVWLDSDSCSFHFGWNYFLLLKERLNLLCSISSRNKQGWLKKTTKHCGVVIYQNKSRRSCYTNCSCRFVSILLFCQVRTSWHIVLDNLRSFQTGPLEKVRIAKDRDGRQKNFAFITYCHEVSVPYAISLFRGTALFHKTLTRSDHKLTERKIRFWRGDVWKEWFW